MTLITGSFPFNSSLKKLYAAAEAVLHAITIALQFVLCLQNKQVARQEELLIWLLPPLVLRYQNQKFQLDIPDEHPKYYIPNLVLTKLVTSIDS